MCVCAATDGTQETSGKLFRGDIASLQHGCCRFSGMMPGAVVPPYEDHTYAQYRHRDENPTASEQPSPFKKLAGSPRSVTRCWKRMEKDGHHDNKNGHNPGNG